MHVCNYYFGNLTGVKLAVILVIFVVFMTKTGTPAVSVSIQFLPRQLKQLCRQLYSSFTCGGHQQDSPRSCRDAPFSNLLTSAAAISVASDNLILFTLTPQLYSFIRGRNQTICTKNSQLPFLIVARYMYVHIFISSVVIR